PASVVGIDSSERFIEYARAHVQDERATFRVGEAQALESERGEFDIVVSGRGLNFVANPARLVSEMRRACRLNGRVAAYVWDYAGEMQLIRYFWDTAAELNPAVRDLDEGSRFPIANQRRLWDLFLDSGLNDVRTRAIDVPTYFRDFEDYWTPFLGGVGPAPAYIVSLAEEQRTALREQLRARLPQDRDGSIKLQARAWAVRGTR